MKQIIREIGMKKSLLVNGDEITMQICLLLITTACIAGLIFIFNFTKPTLGWSLIAGLLMITGIISIMGIAGLEMNDETNN